MPIEERYLNEHVAKFLVFLDACYDGKLKAFSDEFSNFDNAFYEKLKKEDVFKKYNFLLEYKLWDKNNIDLKNKKFNLQLGGLIKSLCK